MIAAGRWVPANPDSPIRGYHINCLYYQFGLGPRWIDLVREWLDAQNDPASLKTFVNDRLAETWEDPKMRAVKHNVIADRAEGYRLRYAPRGVLAITVGVDTQDNRLAVHVVGWGRGMTAWTLDYVELAGDPAEEDVWVALTDLLNRPIEREDGVQLRASATAIDAGGHRTEAVKNYVRQRKITRVMCIFGAVPNNAPILSKGKLADVTWKERTDKRGITITSALWRPSTTSTAGWRPTRSVRPRRGWCASAMSCRRSSSPAWCRRSTTRSRTGLRSGSRAMNR